MQDEQERKRAELASMGFFAHGTIGKDVTTANKLTVINHPTGELSDSSTGQTVVIEPNTNSNQDRKPQATFIFHKGITGNAVISKQVNIHRKPLASAPDDAKIAKISVNSQEGKGTFSSEEGQTYGTFQSQGNKVVVDVAAVGDEDIVELGGLISKLQHNSY